MRCLNCSRLELSTRFLTVSGSVVPKKGGMTVAKNEKNKLIELPLVGVCALIIENSTRSQGRIIFRYPSLMKCKRGWLTTPTPWMATLGIIKFLSILKMRVRPPSHVHTTLLAIDE
jgi:hypothetical protein